MPSIDLNKAIHYVSENGTILERARLLYLLMEVEPSREAYQKLLDSQNADGGFPNRPMPGSQSSVDSTLTALWQFDELGLMHTSAAQKTLDFLIQVQHADGGLDENPSLPEHDLPPWIRPGALPTRLYLTTYAAYWLGVVTREDASPNALRAESFRRMLGFIAGEQQPDGKIPGYMHNNWLGASAFLLGGSGYAQNAQHALGYLSSLPPAEWADSQVAWALDCLTRAGLPFTHPFAQAALQDLVARQAADGSWASEDGPSFAASATVGALKVLQHAGLLQDLDEA